MAEPNVIYKITILNLLSNAGFALSNQQITDFFLDGEYTDFFTAQQAISELADAGLLEVSASHNTTQYAITEQGRATLMLMRDKITEAIDRECLEYLSLHRLEMKKENSLTAGYDRATGGGYFVHCKMQDDSKTIMDLNFHVATREQADTICNNWKVRHEDVYMQLMDVLIQ